MLYVGLDVHYRTSTLAIVDSHGREVKNQTVRGPVARTVDVLRSLAARDQLSICYEASVGYGTLFDELSSFASSVSVAHPGALRLIFKSKRKNDRIDASRLAKLLYLGEVPRVHVPSGRVRAWRELIETRRRTIDKWTMVKNALKAILRGRHVEPVFKGKSLWTKKGHQWLEELELDDTARMRRTLLLAELDQLEMHVKMLTRELDRIAVRHAGVKLLMTIPGVGPRTAECLIAYIDDIRRFTHTGQVSSYFGLVPCQDASAGTNRLGHITKNGPATAMNEKGNEKGERKGVTTESDHVNEKGERKGVTTVNEKGSLLKAISSDPFPILCERKGVTTDRFQ